MSTKQDIIINSGEWYNLRGLSSIPLNKLVLQNKGYNELLLSYNDTPSHDSREGFILVHAQFIKTDATYVFVKSISGAGTIYVEEVV